MSGLDMNEIFELLGSLAEYDDECDRDYKHYLLPSHRRKIDALLSQSKLDKILNEEESE